MVGTKEQIKAYIEQLPSDDTRYTIDKYREKRSKDANALFHVMADKLRLQLGMSMARMKNMLVARYGEIMYLPNGDHAIFKSNVSPEIMCELETPHTCHIKTVEENGKDVHYYRLYHRTRDYNSKSMSRLIDGTIEECKEQGIETASPDEIARLNALWKRDHG